MDDPQVEVLEKSCQQVEALAVALRTIHKCVTEFPEARTIVGRSFRTPSVKAAGFRERFVRPKLYTQYVPAIVEALRNYDGEEDGMTTGEVERATQIARHTVRKVFLSQEHQHLFQGGFGSTRHRLRWRLNPKADLSAYPPAKSKKLPKKKIKVNTLSPAKGGDGEDIVFAPGGRKVT